MIVIGVDPHKASHTAAALETATHQSRDKVRIEATLREYRRLLRWARRFDQRRWAVENAQGLGRHLAQWLVARGATVVNVPATATARVRQPPRRHGEATEVAAEGPVTMLAMLDERRTNLTGQRTRTVNQLHALLREVLAGGVSTDWTADQAATTVGKARPASPVERARKDLARELIADIRRLDARLQTNQQRMQNMVADSASSLTEIVGVGPVVAARLWGAPEVPRAFPQLLRSRPIPGWLPSRLPAPTRPDTAYLATATAS